MEDDAWEKFAKADPYWAVITDSRYKVGADGALSGEERTAFFRSGEEHITRIASTLKTHFGRQFTHRDCSVDFGCGVGRLLIPMARRCGRAIGLDISSTMRRLSMENALANRIGNIECYSGIDHAALAEVQFDWVNSYIVFQHLDTGLGYHIFDALLRHVKPRGAISVHFTVFKDKRLANYITDQMQYFSVDQTGVKTVSSDDPYYPANAMMMNDYDINRIYMLLEKHGFRSILTEHENQDGMHGLIFYGLKAHEGDAR